MSFMDKRKLSLLLKRNIKKIQNKDLYDYLDSYSLGSSELSISLKLQINSFEKTLLDVRDLKKLLNFLSKVTGTCSFVVSKDHLFYSGSDRNSDFTTFKKLGVYRKTLESTKLSEFLLRVRDKEVLHDFNIQIEPKMNKIQIEDSVLISVKLPNSDLYLGFLGSIDGDIDLLVAMFKYLSNSKTFNERLSRIFN
jgi:hypothetical protein